MLFELVPGGFSYLINWNNWNLIEKNIGIQKHAGKVTKYLFHSTYIAPALIVKLFLAVLYQISDFTGLRKKE